MNIKETENALMNPDFVIEILTLFAKYGLVNEVAVRNSLIRKEYYGAKESGKNLKDFRYYLAEKYLLSDKQIEAIIYGTTKLKTNIKVLNPDFAICNVEKPD